MPMLSLDASGPPGMTNAPGVASGWQSSWPTGVTVQARDPQSFLPSPRGLLLDIANMPMPKSGCVRPGAYALAGTRQKLKPFRPLGTSRRRQNLALCVWGRTTRQNRTTALTSLPPSVRRLRLCWRWSCGKYHAHQGLREPNCHRSRQWSVHQRYAHLSGVANGIKIGTKVKAGDQIGLSGRTGNVPPKASAHLHFEVGTGNSLPHKNGGHFCKSLDYLPSS